MFKRTRLTIRNLHPPRISEVEVIRNVNAHDRPHLKSIGDPEVKAGLGVISSIRDAACLNRQQLDLFSLNPRMFHHSEKASSALTDWWYLQVSKLLFTL